MNSQKVNWIIPKIWPDSTVFIIGGGPSVNKAPLHLLEDKNVIGVNNAFELGDFVDVCWFGDQRWLTWNSAKLREFNGYKMTCAISGFPNQKCWPGINHVTRENKFGICTAPNKVYWNQCSGASAINLAYHFGARKIVLIGFDMKTVGNKFNYHEFHTPHHVPRKDVYNRYLPAFKNIKVDADKLGLVILNATPDSRIKEFEIVRLEDEV